MHSFCVAFSYLWSKAVFKEQNAPKTGILKIKTLIYSILFLASAATAAGQDAHEVTGTVRDLSDGRPLVGAVVVSGGIEAASDASGRYTLTLNGGTHKLSCLMAGYAPAEKSVAVTGPVEIDFTLTTEYYEIDGVVVTAESTFNRVRNVQIGVERVGMDEVAKMPSMFGEHDIMKSIQLLPGVKAESDGSSGFQVRGGTTSQNMVLLDDAPVYNSGHLLGFFSAFSDEALLDASLYKGLIPAQYGGGTSSVFEINTRNGDSRRFGFGGSIGLLSAKLHAEGPIVRDKMSFFAAARRTYLDAFLNLTDEYAGNTINFYDLNAKINYDIGPRDNLFVSFFTGRDKLALNDNSLSMKWGNMTGTMRWVHRFGNSVKSTTSLIYSDYSTTNGAEVFDMFYTFDGYIRQVGIKENVRWTPSASHSVDMGFQSMYLGVQSAEWEIGDRHEREKRRAWENTLWINDEWKASRDLTISAGLRFNMFSVLGGSPYYILYPSGDIAQTLDYGRGEIVKTHLTLEPRVSLNWRFTDRQSLKAGYSRTSQNIHAVRNTSIALPFDRYTMSSNIVKPQTADQVSVGYAALTPSSVFEFSAETYYKNVRNVLDYRDGKSFQSEIEIERIIAAGKGRAYGIEFLARKGKGKLTGWISYTLSWSQNRIPGINGGEWYTAGNDRRHDISVVAMYEFNEHWRAAATWVYNTGQAMTAPNAKYEIDGETVYYYAERNSYRAPDYHRLDASVTYTKQSRRWTHEVSVGVFNLYNRYNPFIISFEDDDSSESGTKATQLSLFGIVPSVSYNFKF